MVRLRLAFAAALFVVTVAPTFAVQPDEILPDPALERRARAISADLRCLVCQNQSIDESDAPLARDLRILVRDRLKSGEADAKVRDFIVQRYGDFVLLRPRFALHTALLWLAPVLALGLGALGLVLALRRRRVATSAPLTPDEEAALARALQADGAPLAKS
jgi:cytochrome c-type biogenesis protein CcmH